jgi:hypothetical protein
MAFNVDSISVTLMINEEFSSGAHPVTFEYVPADGCPLVAEALRKLHEIREQERLRLAAGPPADIGIF